MRALLLDDTVLVRAVASGRQKGRTPSRRRVELRYVDLKAGRRLQVTAYDETQAHTSNHAPGEAARTAVDDLLDEPFGNWHVETTDETVQLRVTKKGEALVHRTAASRREVQTRSHDRAKQWLLDPGDPLFTVVGGTAAKRRQVDAFLRLVAPSVAKVPGVEHLGRPLRVVDLGCGNAYLTFAAHRYLGHVRGMPVHTTGVDVKAQSRQHNSEVARSLGLADEMSFVQGDIGTVELDERPDVVLALHACDTATDDALARAVTWDVPLVLAAPCCHHDVAAQLRRTPTPAPYTLLTRSGILRERFADTLTDALRAAVLRLLGYRVDVIDFVDSKHTPRNTLLRAVRTGAPRSAEQAAELADLTRTWGVDPRLAELLRDRLA